MSTFITTIKPTPYGFFDADPAFQVEAEATVTFIKRKLGDDVLSVELTRREIWTCLEEATLEYGSIINQYKLRSELANLLGMPTVYSGSVVSGTFVVSSSVSSTYPRRTLEFLMRQAEPYGSYAGNGGSYDTYMTYVDIVSGQQDYNIYNDLKRGEGPMSGSNFFATLPSGSEQGKLRVLEVFHFSPVAAQHMLLNASNITNFLATEFAYESYVNSTVFYVLPVFEDVLRRGQLELANRVRRSNFYYQLIGRNLRIYPTPDIANHLQTTRLWLRVATGNDPTQPSYSDSTLTGISTPSQVPFTNVQFAAINDMGRQWIRQYCLTLCRELLGLIRRKMKRIPIPGQELELDGAELVTEAREMMSKMHDELKEMVESLTYDKLIAIEAEKAENINKQLKFIPMPLGKAIIIG